jgi:hypothetical protein
LVFIFEKIMNGNIACRNCQFWVELANSFGECRKKPPTPFVNPKTNDAFTRALFPTTREDDWCAEIRPRKMEKAPDSSSSDVLEI